MIPEPQPEEDISPELPDRPLEMPLAAPKKNLLSQVDKTTQVNVEYAEPKRKSVKDNYKSVTQVIDDEYHCYGDEFDQEYDMAFDEPSEMPVV